MSRYSMGAESEGVVVAAVPFNAGRSIYDDPRNASVKKEDQPIDVLDAGVLPIRLIVKNQSRSEIVLDPNQITGRAGELSYRIYSSQEAVELVVKSAAFKKALKGSRVAPVVKSILGGEIIVGAAEGGVSGAASGGVTGGATGAAKGAASFGWRRAFAYEKGLTRLISREYDRKAIKKQTLYPGFTADGVIFLPSNAGITALHLQAYDLNRKKEILLHIALETTE
ncbi:MAG: hypothetical protein ACE5J1_06380 [Nitrospiria bacterium]